MCVSSGCWCSPRKRMTWLKHNKGLVIALALTVLFIAAEAVVMYWRGPSVMVLVPLALLVV